MFGRPWSNFPHQIAMLLPDQANRAIQAGGGSHAPHKFALVRGYSLAVRQSHVRDPVVGPVVVVCVKLKAGIEQ